MVSQEQRSGTDFGSMRHDHCDHVDVHREDELWQLDSIPK